MVLTPLLWVANQIVSVFKNTAGVAACTRSVMGIRSKIGGSDFASAARTGYLQGGFGVKVARQPKRLIKNSEFANNSDVVDFIKKKFPFARTYGKHCGCERCEFSRSKIPTDTCRCRWCRQAVLAARWTIVIFRYFRMGEPDTHIDLDNGWKIGTCAGIVQKIRRRIAGQREDGLPRTGQKRGRPKISAIVADVSYLTESTVLVN
jgi:hypothetical protein